MAKGSLDDPGEARVSPRGLSQSTLSGYHPPGGMLEAIRRLEELGILMWRDGHPKCQERPVTTTLLVPDPPVD